MQPPLCSTSGRQGGGWRQEGSIRVPFCTLPLFLPRGPLFAPSFFPPGWKRPEGVASKFIGPPSRKSGRPPPGKRDGIGVTATSKGWGGGALHLNPVNLKPGTPTLKPELQTPQQAVLDWIGVRAPSDWWVGGTLHPNPSINLKP